MGLATGAGSVETCAVVNEVNSTSDIPAIFLAPRGFLRTLSVSVSVSPSLRLPLSPLVATLSLSFFHFHVVGPLRSVPHHTLVSPPQVPISPT